jgi:prepilin-type N-terminal cleavage/methylation domain-containing protein
MRRGFTLLELVVVIAVVAILVAIIFPALHRVRESARRLQCSTHLRQIGLALHSYESQHQMFPLIYSWDRDRVKMFSAQARLLPFLDELIVYNQINFDVGAGAFADSNPDFLVNWTAATASIALLRAGRKFSPSVEPSKGY